MITNNNAVFDNAQLALAAYAKLDRFKLTDDDDNKRALVEEGMSEKQAELFAKRWPEIVEQYNDPISGLSATLFRNGSEVCLAIAGTDDLMDLIVDIGVFEGVGAPAQYNALQAFYGSLIATGKIQASDTLTVTGHSLGGLLAQFFAIDHMGEVSQTYTYNAPGIGGIVAEVFELIGISASANINAAHILNIQGDGFSATAGLGTLLGSVQKTSNVGEWL